MHRFIVLALIMAAYGGARHARTPTLATANDRAVARIVVGGQAEAIELLDEAEEAYPGDAKVAANPGTAFEGHPLDDYRAAQRYGPADSGRILAVASARVGFPGAPALVAPGLS